MDLILVPLSWGEIRINVECLRGFFTRNVIFMISLHAFFENGEWEGHNRGSPQAHSRRRRRRCQLTRHHHSYIGSTSTSLRRERRGIGEKERVLLPASPILTCCVLCSLGAAAKTKMATLTTHTLARLWNIVADFLPGERRIFSFPWQSLFMGTRR